MSGHARSEERETRSKGCTRTDLTLSDLIFSVPRGHSTPSWFEAEGSVLTRRASRTLRVGFATRFGPRCRWACAGARLAATPRRARGRARDARRATVALSDEFRQLDVPRWCADQFRPVWTWRPDCRGFLGVCFVNGVRSGLRAMALRRVVGLRPQERTSRSAGLRGLIYCRVRTPSHVPFAAGGSFRPSDHNDCYRA